MAESCRKPCFFCSIGEGTGLELGLLNSGDAHGPVRDVFNANMEAIWKFLDSRDGGVSSTCIEYVEIPDDAVNDPQFSSKKIAALNWIAQNIDDLEGTVAFWVGSGSEIDPEFAWIVGCSGYGIDLRSTLFGGNQNGNGDCTECNCDCEYIKIKQLTIDSTCRIRAIMEDQDGNTLPEIVSNPLPESCKGSSNNGGEDLVSTSVTIGSTVDGTLVTANSATWPCNAGRLTLVHQAQSQGGAFVGYVDENCVPHKNEAACKTFCKELGQTNCIQSSIRPVDLTLISPKCDTAIDCVCLSIQPKLGDPEDVASYSLTSSENLVVQMWINTANSVQPLGAPITLNAGQPKKVLSSGGVVGSSIPAGSRVGTTVVSGGSDIEGFTLSVEASCCV